MTGGEALHFDNVATLTLQRSRHIIKRSLGGLAQHGLSALEEDFRLICRLVLVDIGDNLLDRVQAGVGLLRGLLRGLRLVPGVDCVLVGFISLRRSQLDSLLSAGVGVFDRFRVR